MMPEMPAITPDSLIALLDDLKIEYSLIIDQLNPDSPAPGLG